MACRLPPSGHAACGSIEKTAIRWLIKVYKAGSNILRLELAGLEYAND